jgi:serine protease
MFTRLSRVLPITAACAAIALTASNAQSDRIIAPGPSGIDLGPITQRELAGTLPVAGGSHEDAVDPDEIIVAFTGGTVTGQVAAGVAAGAGVRVAGMRYPPHADFALVRLGEGEDPERAARGLAAVKGVRYAQPRYRMYPDARPNDPLYSQQWNLPLIDMERAWEINPGGHESIIVAVIDTGVAHKDATVTYNARSWPMFVGGTVTTFPALGEVSIPFSMAPDLGPASRFVAPRDFIWNDTSPFDFVGHGTHVAGTIGQTTNNGVGPAGIAYNVKIMPVKVISDIWDSVFGATNTGTDDVVAQGVRYAVDNGARILNMSIGRSGPPAPAIESALRYAVDRGAFVVISGGNSFETGNPIHRPADIAERIEGVIAVGAVDRVKNKAPYSSTGSWIEIAAPGGNTRLGSSGGVLQQTVSSADSQTYRFGPAFYTAPRFDRFTYSNFQGTSMAAPHVSGLAALLMHQGIRNPATIERAIKHFASDLGTAGRDNQFGHGLINARATLRGLGLAK